MNENFTFNDTFDNISFSESGKIKSTLENLKSAARDLLSDVKQKNSENQSISFDDSIFLSESFTTQCNLKENVEKNNESILNTTYCVTTFPSKDSSADFSSLDEQLKLKRNTNSLENLENKDDFRKQVYKGREETNCQSKQYKNLQNIFKPDLSDENGENRTIQDYNHCKLSEWNLPEAILQKYKNRNITEMFLWQCECLQNKEVFENNKNLVYSAPTSAGKTLVSEILALKTLLERKKKVIFILPFVSVVREKMFYFQDILNSSGIRVEGFMGSYSPPGGFQNIQLAICTIEKANSLINRLLEENKLQDVGTIIVDEIHLLGDPSRGYLLELLLTKLNYMTSKHKDINIQIIGMSATLPNLNVLANWLNASLYITTFRPIPLFEYYYVQGEIYDNTMTFMRKLPVLKELETDTDNILQLCLETIQNSCSVLIFCPTKSWCENLAQQIAVAIWKLGNSKIFGDCLRSQLNVESICEVLEQLKRCPVGLDKILNKTISFAVAFHHAGLTMDERDIIENAFRSNAVRVLIATSTLSSGVNLPARRVIIRTPLFHGKPLDTLTYKQMIGRAGRMGKDTCGESLLICQKNEYKVAEQLMSTNLQPIESCLSGSGKLKRALLEVIASDVVSTPDELILFTTCTLFANENGETLQSPIKDAMDFLTNCQFIRLQTSEDGSKKYIATSLGKACLTSSLPPEEGLTLFTELEKARQCFVLETELHLIYLVTPYSVCNQWGNIDWMFFLNMWEKLPASMKRVGDLIGVRESFIVNASRGKIQTNTNQNYHQLQIHKRFYTALALQDLVNEIPLNDVATKFNCSRGMLQTLQQSASTFAGMVTSFSKQLGWSSVEILISQFQDRLNFGVNRDLLDLMRLPVLNGPRARALYNAGIETLVQLASSSRDIIENALYKAVPFESEKARDGETKYEAKQRNKMRTIWVTGKQGLTEKEAAAMLISDAQHYLKLEMGLLDAKWENGTNTIHNISADELETDNLNTNAETKVPLSKVEQRNVNENLETNNSNIVNSDKIVMKNDQLESEIPYINTQIEITSDQVTFLKDRSTEHVTEESTLLDFVCKKNNEFLRLYESSNNETNFKERNKNDLTFNKQKGLNNSIEDKSQFDDIMENKPFSDSGGIINWSSDSLFENSMESFEITNRLCIHRYSTDEISKELNVQNLDNDTFLKSALSLNSNLTDSNDIENNTVMVSKSVECNSSINTSNECILSTQVNVADTPLNKYEPNYVHGSNRKRSRSIEDIINFNSDSSFLEQTPTKKIKECQRKYLKKCRLNRTSKNVDNTFVIPHNSQVLTISYKNIQKMSTDLTKIEIINVCENKRLFDCFCNELQKQTDISLSVGCVKMESVQTKIGNKVLNTKNNFNSKDVELSYNNRQIKCISISWGGNTAYYIDFDCKFIDLKDKITLIKRTLNNHNLKVKIFDCKEQIKVLRLCLAIDITVKLEDPKIADWLLNPEVKEKNLQAMALKYTPEAVKLTQLSGNCRGVGSVGLDLYSSVTPRIRSSVEAISTWHLVDSILDLIAQQEMQLLHTYYIEMKSIAVLLKMELNGICINKYEIERLADTLKEHCLMLEKKAYNLAGRHFSFTSPTEVAKVLGIYKGKRVSTSKQILEQNENPISSLIIQWRKLNCILTKTIYPFLKMIQNERIHGSCITFSATGRISMHEPNLQNVPKDFEFTNPWNGTSTIVSCRNVFQTANNFVLISADYCQLELRLLAHFSKDQHLCLIMKTKKDVFKSIAAKLNNIDETKVTDQLRQKAKQICYGIIYGMSVKSLADQLNFSIDEANTFLEDFHKKYPSINVYIQKIINECKIDGYVETIAGRRRYLPNINHQSMVSRNQAERQAVNTIIQGSAADIAKNAMILIDTHIEEKFKLSKHKPKLILQLHDEFIYELPEKYAKTLSKIMKNCMENSVRLKVPFPVKIKQGKSWGNLTEITM